MMEKIKINSINLNMDIDNYEVIYCADDDEYRVYCDVCDKLCIQRFYKIHSKSKTQINDIRKKKKISINII